MRRTRTRIELAGVPGVFNADQLRQTGTSIARMQHPSGAIPWFPGGPIDPWDHVEAAMGLTVAGLWEQAAAAYAWSAANQRADGSWPMKINSDETIADPGTDANFNSYLAVGVWHYWLITSDLEFLERMWPVVCAAIDKTLDMRTPNGMIAWAEDQQGNRWDEALITGSASVHHALLAAQQIGEQVGQRRPEWQRAREQIGHDLRHRSGDFADRRRHAMDWYYPILGGAITGQQAVHRIARRWAEFVVPEFGVRCVRDQPWVTGAETAELAICLAGLGESKLAAGLLGDVQHLREPGDGELVRRVVGRTDLAGSYWTGLVLSDGLRWPVELSSWTAAAMLLAADAITESTSGYRVHRRGGR